MAAAQQVAATSPITRASKAPLHSGAFFAFPATLITLVGAFLRLFRIDEFPVGFHFDEAANAIDLARLGPNFHPIYFTANNGREPLFFYWSALFVHFVGLLPLSLRLASAFACIASIAATYFCFSQLFATAENRALARRIALFTAAVYSLIFFGLIFSREGFRIMTVALVEPLAIGLLAQAYRIGGWQRWIGGGVLLGLCLYTTTSARLIGLGALLFGIYALAFHFRRIYWPGWIIAAAAGAVVVLPFGIYALRNKAAFMQRTTGVVITDPAVLAHQTLETLGMFFVRGTTDFPFNISNQPLFDQLMAGVFMLGILICLTRLRRAAYVLIVIWLVTNWPATIFSVDAPYFNRLTAMLPVVAAFPALALAAAPDVLSGWKIWRFAPSVAVVTISTGVTFYHYFDVWGPSKEAFYGMMQDKVDGATQLQTLYATGEQVFLAPLYDQDWTYIWLTRNMRLQSFEATACTVLPPPGRNAVYVYPFFDQAQPPAILSHLPGRPMAQNLPNSRGEPNLIAIHESAADVPASPAAPAARFGDEIALLSFTVPSQTLHPAETLQIGLTWQSLTALTSDYSAFVHADDSATHRRIAVDAMPCSNSFPTTRWLPGETVIDTYRLTVPADAPAGQYDLTTGLYESGSLTNLKAGDVSDVPIGHVTVVR